MYRDMTPCTLVDILLILGFLAIEELYLLGYNAV
jgi:hypothetical protein